MSKPAQYVSRPRLVGLSPRGMIIAALVSFLLALVTYDVLTNLVYRNLTSAYQECRVIPRILRSDPSVATNSRIKDALTEGASNKVGARAAALHHAARLLGVVAPVDTLPLQKNQNPRFGEHPLRDVLQSFAVGSDPTDCEALLKIPTIKQIAMFLPHGRNAVGLEPKDWARSVSNAFAAVLAGSPGSADAWDRFLAYLPPESKATDITLADFKDQLERASGRWKGFSLFWYREAYFPASIPRSQEILGRAFAQTGFNEENSLHFAGTSDVTSPDAAIRQKNIEFLSAIVSSLHADPSVRKARMWISMVVGPEQIGLLACAWCMVIVLFIRWFRRIDFELVLNEIVQNVKDVWEKPLRIATPTPTTPVAPHWYDQEYRLNAIIKVRKSVERTPADYDASARRLLDEPLRIVQEQLQYNPPPSMDALSKSLRVLRSEDSISRWSLTWLARATPAIGFLGTVRGIWFALANADSIVTQRSPADQAAAISDVAGMLGIAFTTTLIALSVGLVTSWASDRQAVRERAVLDSLEAVLQPFIEPSLRPVFVERGHNSNVSLGKALKLIIAELRGPPRRSSGPTPPSSGPTVPSSGQTG